MNYSRANVSSGPRKKLQSAGFANAETFVPQRGVGRGVVYAFCEMHNKCTKCTTDILRDKPQTRKTARKIGVISTKGVTVQQANSGVNTTQKGSQESSQEIRLANVSEGARRIYGMISTDGLLKIKDMAAEIGVSTRMVMKYLKELEPLGVRHIGSTKKGRWVIGA